MVTSIDIKNGLAYIPRPMTEIANLLRLRGLKTVWVVVEKIYNPTTKGNSLGPIENNRDKGESGKNVNKG